MNDETPLLLEVRALRKYFPVRQGLLRRSRAHVRAVDDVSFGLGPGRTLGLVGESGCGKSTLGRTVLRLQDPTAGQVLFEGVDITALDRRELLPWRRRMQIVFQDPYGSLSPRRTVGQTLREPLDVHGVGTPASRRERVVALLEEVGLGAAALDRYPHEFSGGQRQRIGIARALALEPRFIVADEPVSALDVSVRSQILNLVRRLQRDRGIAFLFISHDLSVIAHVSDDIGVMYLGKLVELAPAAALVGTPRHPYTAALLSAVPEVGARRPARIPLRGEPPTPTAPPPGCAFHQRCPRVLPICRSVTPPLVEVGSPGAPHRVACHLHAPTSGGAGPPAGSGAPESR